MNIAIDGIIFSLQRHGGISVYFRELLAHIGSAGLAAELTLETPLMQHQPIASAPLRLQQRPARRMERYRHCRLSSMPDVFHSSYYRQPALAKTPTVVTVHDFNYERFMHGPRLWVHVAQKHAAIRAGQALICISQATRDELDHWVGVRPDQQVHVIHNGVSPTFRPIEVNGQRPPFLLFVGMRGGYKNFALVVAAMRGLPDFDLLCVGGGALKAAEVAQAPQDVRRRIRHAGQVDDETLNRLYNEAVCLIYPSRQEGFGIPVVEAMRAGCPVICVDCKAVLEVGGTALSIVGENEPAAMAHAVLALVEPGHRRAVIERGYRQSAGFSWAASHARTLDVYRTVADIGRLA
jgi:mannosyltransferase